VDGESTLCGVPTPISQSKPTKRARCENCHALYHPNPRRPKQKFCSENCRKEFHRYGSSYGPLKTGLHKAIDKKYAELEKFTRAALVGLARRIENVEKGILGWSGPSYHERIERLAVEVADVKAQMQRARSLRRCFPDLRPLIVRPTSPR